MNAAERDIDAIVAFYRARLDEEQAAAQAVGGSGHWAPYIEGGDDGWAIEDSEKGDPGAIIGDEAMAKHIARHDPARALRQVAAGRALIRLYELARRQLGASLPETEMAADAILLQAAVWEGHEDWKPEWRDDWLNEALPHSESETT